MTTQMQDVRTDIESAQDRVPRWAEGEQPSEDFPHDGRLLVLRSNLDGAELLDRGAVVDAVDLIAVNPDASWTIYNTAHSNHGTIRSRIACIFECMKAGDDEQKNGKE